MFSNRESSAVGSRQQQCRSTVPIEVSTFGEVLAQQPLVFSFVPRCHGQKNTCSPVSIRS